MNYSVEEIEDGLKAALAGASALDYLKDVFSLASLAEKDLLKEAAYGPRIGVISVEGAYDNDINGIQDETGGFAVVALNRNLRAAAAAVNPDVPGEIGCWKILADARRVLLNHKLGLETTGCRIIRRRLLVATSAGAAAMLEVYLTWRHAPGS